MATISLADMIQGGISLVTPPIFQTAAYILPSQLSAGNVIDLIELDLPGQGVILTTLMARLGASGVTGITNTPTVTFGFNEAADNLVPSAAPLPLAPWALVDYTRQQSQGAEGDVLRMKVQTGAVGTGGGSPIMVFMAGMVLG